MQKRVLIIGILIVIMCMMFLLTGCEKKNEEAENSNISVSNTNTEIDEENSKIAEKKDEENHDAVITEKDGDFIYKIKSDIQIDDYIDIDLSEIFDELKNKENAYTNYCMSYIYSYSYGVGSDEETIEYDEDDEISFSFNMEDEDYDINVMIAEVEAESAEDFIKDVVKTDGLSEDDDMYSIELNDLTWYIVGYMTDDKIVYYNAFDKNGKVFLCRYDIKNSITDEALLNTYNEIIMAIKAKDFEADEDDKNTESDENDKESNTEESRHRDGAFVYLKQNQ